MSEFIKTAEVIGNLAQRAYNVGQFVMERFKGGAWSNVAPQEPQVEAQMTLNIEREQT